MNLKRMTLTALLTLGLTAIPVLAQDTSTTTHHNVPTTKAQHAMTKGTDKKLDINTATKDQLAALPGMTPDQAQKVIESRPYTMKSQLVSRDIVSKAEYAKIKGDVIAKKSVSGSAATTAKTTTKHTKKTATTTASPS